jgi:negative elongation factor B
MNSNVPEGGQQDGAKEKPKIGADGMAYVSHTLSSLQPQTAVRQIQSKCSLQQPLCTPLLGMLDHLGVSRADAHRGVLVAAKQALLFRIGGLHKVDQVVTLERMLNASFAFLGMQELRDVPLAVMEKLDQVRGSDSDRLGHACACMHVL